MRRLLACAVVAGALVAPAAAGAHIQVRPAVAAPGDPVLWEVVVPSEEEAGTRQVELQVPKDVLPFSFEDTPGWTRTLRTGGDGSVASIVWTGRTRGDGLATFRFLASTPEREGTLEWKALQTYRDGHVVRWIGDEGADTPASLTVVSRDVPRQNAGGEGASGADGSASPASSSSSSSSADGGADWVARGLGLAGLLVGLVGVGVRRRR